jgi:hypothetical protein
MQIAKSILLFPKQASQEYFFNGITLIAVHKTELSYRHKGEKIETNFI